MSAPMVLADTDWHKDALALIEAFAASGLPFSADDLRKCIRPAPQPNDIGAVFRAACNSGLITSCGYLESTTPSRKGGVIRMWQRASKS